MRIADQQKIRDKTAAIIVDWAKQRQPEFTGETSDGFVEAVTVAHLVADEARLGLHRWVDAARRTGISWTEVGAVLGISKQAAQQRFRAADSEDSGAGAADATIVRLGATAFNEMSMMRAEGLKGNELVATGALKLAFRSTDHVWEYRRRIGPSPDLTAAGWVHVSTWLPFFYYKRPLIDG